jgi:hypothetical protein
MTATVTEYRSTAPAGHDGFGTMLRAEWTKFRTVRAWVIGMVAAVGHGYAALSLTDGTTLRAVGGSVLYLALIALLSVGLATAIRESAVAIDAVLAVLYVIPILSAVVTDTHGQRHLEQMSPSLAGLSIRATVGVGDLPIARGAASACSDYGRSARCCWARSCCASGMADGGKLTRGARPV